MHCKHWCQRVNLECIGGIKELWKGMIKVKKGPRRAYLWTYLRGALVNCVLVSLWDGRGQSRGLQKNLAPAMDASTEAVEWR